MNKRSIITILIIVLLLFSMTVACVDSGDPGEIKDTYSIHKTAVYGEQQWDNQLKSISATQWENQMRLNGTPAP